MTGYPVRENEAERLEALRSLDLASSFGSPDLDAVTGLAREICRVPTALIALIDEDRQWNVARGDFPEPVTARERAICNHTITRDGILLVEDVRADSRFRDNPLVSEDGGIRFYAGYPLELDPGLPVGALCVLDTTPRTLTWHQIEQFRRLAQIATALLRQHRDAVRIARLSQSLGRSGEQIAEQSRSLTRRNRMLDDACVLGEMGVFDHDLRTGHSEWSDMLRRMHDIGDDDPIDQAADFSHMKRFYGARDLERYVRLVREAEHSRGAVDFEAPLKTAKGRRRWVRLRVGFEYDETGRPVRRFGMMQDITRQKHLLRRLDYLANRDSLTGLYNRNHFLKCADQYLAERADRLAGLAIVDLDGFKAVNDSYGHGAGDACLKVIAARLKAESGKDWLLVRPGGDEFTILFAERTDLAGLTAMFEKLRQVIQQPIEWRGLTFQVSASIGLALRTDGGRAANAMELVQEADLAVYKAKAAGKNCLALYSSDLHTVALHRFNVIARARAALERGDFCLFYQPKIALADRSLSGFEALLRWRQDDGRFAAPGEFLAALDDAETSRRIGDFVMREAVRQAAAWRRSGFGFGNIAINVSSSQFDDRHFVDALIAEVGAAGLAPGDIHVEVTEGVLLSTGATSVAPGLKRLSDHGIRIAFDDFGTGYASLVHLRQLEFDVIKLDKSFIQSMLTSNADMAIVQAVLILAGRLGKKVVAEGVETETQLEMLRAHGCQFGQGYLFARPKPAAAVRAEWGILAEAV